MIEYPVRSIAKWHDHRVTYLSPSPTQLSAIRAQLSAPVVAARTVRNPLRPMAFMFDEEF